MSVCLDSFALLAWLQGEAGAALVERQLGLAGEERGESCYVSWVNLGEVYYHLARGRGPEAADRFWRDSQGGSIPLTPMAVTQRRVREAARLKGRYAIAYADAFALQLAKELGTPLVTGDPEIQAVSSAVGVELVWLRVS